MAFLDAGLPFYQKRHSKQQYLVVKGVGFKRHTRQFHGISAEILIQWHYNLPTQTLTHKHFGGEGGDPMADCRDRPPEDGFALTCGLRIPAVIEWT